MKLSLTRGKNSSPALQLINVVCHIIGLNSRLESEVLVMKRVRGCAVFFIIHTILRLLLRLLSSHL